AGRDQRLQEVLLGYFEAVEAGQAPDRNELLRRHPDLATDLAEFLTGHDRLDHWMESLRASGTMEASSSANVDRTLGDTRIVREVGRGGMGVVYEAEQISLGRRVALKVLPLAATMDPRQLQRFQNEARAAAGLHHTNIVPVFSVGCERGVHFYAMQF